MGQLMDDQEAAVDPHQTVAQAGEAYLVARDEHDAAKVTSTSADTASVDARTALGEAATRQTDAETDVMRAINHANETEQESTQ
jgi:hypothetical protein